MKNFSKKILKGLFASLVLWTNLQGEEFWDEEECPLYCDLEENCQDSCECAKQFWVNAEYLYWTIKDSPQHVPLVISGSIVANDPPGQNGNPVILGGKDIRNNWRSGGRFALGYWFDCNHRLGAEANYFFLPKNSKTRTVSSDGAVGSPLLSIPFFDVTIGEESSVAIASPGSFSGTARLKVVNNMQGAELNGLADFSCVSAFNINLNLLAGFRYWNFDEHLTFSTSSPYINTPDIFKTRDKFHTENNFYGGQIGACLEYCCNQFFLTAKGKVALGSMCEKVIIQGRLLTNDFDDFEAIQAFPGGYFALPSNIRHRRRTEFSVIPEVNINIGCQIMDCLRLQVGYTFLYVSNMLWAGKQMSSKINPTQSSAIEFVPNPILYGRASPKARLKSDSFWAQGVNAGIEFQF